MLSLKQTAAVMVIAFGFLFISTTSTYAQNGVCIVDVAKIFENHSGFKTQIDTLKQQAEEYKFHLQRQSDELKAKAEQLSNFAVGSAEYKALETELAQTSANLEVERRNKTREFVQLEAKVHYDTYAEVSAMISNYCEAHGHRAALRFDSSEMDPTIPASIMQRVNEYVVFYNPRIDITAEIIRSMSQQMSGRTDGAQSR